MRKQLITLAVIAAGVAGNAVASAADVGASTTIDGQVFLDFSDINQKQNGTDVPPSGVGFDVKRAYLIANHTFDDVWSANLTTDAQYISSTAGTGYTNSPTSNSGGATNFYIKLLYLQAKVNDAAVFRLGSYNQPWYQYAVTLYGYRYVEKTATDRLGYSNSADWGLHANGLAGDNGFFNYALAVIDGGGYKNPTRTKVPDYEGQFGVKPLGWLNVGAGFYAGHLGQVTQANNDYPTHTATRWDALVAVVNGPLRVGGEVFEAKNFKAGSASTGVLSGPAGVVVAASATGTLLNDQAQGYSTWAAYTFAPKWTVFGRFDRAHLSEDVDPKLRDTYYHLGVAYKPIQTIDLALVLKHENVQNGTVSIGSGDGNSSYTVGGTGAAGTGAKTDGEFNEVGVYTQYVF